MTAAKPKSTNRLLYDVLSYLKEADREVTAEELMSDLPGYDFKSSEVTQQLQMNAKIHYEDGKYSFKVFNRPTPLIRTTQPSNALLVNFSH